MLVFVSEMRLLINKLYLVNHESLEKQPDEILHVLELLLIDLGDQTRSLHKKVRIEQNYRDVVRGK